MQQNTVAFVYDTILFASTSSIFKASCLASYISQVTITKRNSCTQYHSKNYTV